MRYFICLIFLAVLSVSATAAPPRIVIHEWGTFTNLQDEDGLSVGGINSDDEPLPKFTHTLDINGIIGDAASQRKNRLMQGYPQCHPDVTIRLETPVVYFHPEPGAELSPIEFAVQFRGGYLTQFYPHATAPTMERHISSQTVGTLQWSNLKLGLNEPLPQTTSHVWTAPRDVQAATVTATGGEIEKFLFYRGVGHIDAPLRLTRTGTNTEIRRQLDPTFPTGTELKIAKLWYCAFEDGGRCVFRELTPFTATADRKRLLISTPTEFKTQELSTEHLAELKRSMLTALVDQGLFLDEASALLDTWELSYFKSSGVRLFYIVPPEWIEHYLPVTTSATGEITRVMVGRIDLVTPEHRHLLRQIVNNPDPKKNQDELWHLYERLGRFRNALLLDEQARRPSSAMGNFIAAFGLEASQ